MTDRKKILKMTVILAGLAIFVGGFTYVVKGNLRSLEDYAAANPEITATPDILESAASDTTGTEWESPVSDLATVDSQSNSMQETTANLQNSTETPATSTLIGASLNGNLVKDQRITYAESFYYEPLSDNLRHYITGVSFPAVEESAENTEDWGISYEDLCYLHILHYDFDGNPAEGELICNAAIAQDLVEIFYELYCNEYPLEKVRLIDEYDGDDTASMENNNTSCFNYRVVEGTTSLSKHAMGLALDINPLYNPYITYEKDENGIISGENVSPAAAMDYIDRTKDFPYKIDENDLCYQLFTQHGFTWGGSWNSCKDYQHFQKVVDF